MVVCGGGAAGLSAALAAAKAGARVVLVERAPRLGGTVAAALIHTLAGLYGSQGELLHKGLPADLAHRLAKSSDKVRPRRMGRVWVLQVCPNLYRRVVEDWIRSEPRIRVFTASRIARVDAAAGRVEQVEIRGRQGSFSLRPAAVIDATGTAEIVRLVDPDLLQKDVRAAAGLIFRMRGVLPGALDFPRGASFVRALRAAAAEGRLPPNADKAWIDVGLEEDEAFVKLFVPLPDDFRNGLRRLAIAREARRAAVAVASFLTQFPAFARASVVQIGSLGIRDGGRVRGEYCLSGDDVRQMRKFPDAACRGCWPIEYWDAAQGVSLEYLPDGGYYEIPLRALQVRGWHNVWVAGKCLSADRDAHASARAAGTCWAMGEAVGRTAALCRSPAKDVFYDQPTV